MREAALRSHTVVFACSQAAVGLGRAETRGAAQPRGAAVGHTVTIAETTSHPATRRRATTVRELARHAGAIVGVAPSTFGASAARTAVVIGEGEAGTILQLAAPVVAACLGAATALGGGRDTAPVVIPARTGRSAGPAIGTTRGLTPITSTLASPRRACGHTKTVVVGLRDAAAPERRTLSRRRAGRSGLTRSVSLGGRVRVPVGSYRGVVGPGEHRDLSLPIGLGHHRRRSRRRHGRRRRRRSGGPAPCEQEQREPMALAPEGEEAQPHEPRKPRAFVAFGHVARCAPTASWGRGLEHVDAGIDDVELSGGGPGKDPQARAHREGSVVHHRAWGWRGAHPHRVAHGGHLSRPPRSPDDALDAEEHATPRVVLHHPFEDDGGRRALLFVDLGGKGRTRR